MVTCIRYRTTTTMESIVSINAETVRDRLSFWQHESHGSTVSRDGKV